MEYAIETFSLTKVFSDWWGRNKVCAVDELNLKIHTNEVFGLLGPNGSGKTTTLKLLLGLLHPTKGKAVVLGGDGSDPKITTRVGFMPEESYLYKYLNARETLDFYGRLFSLAPKVRQMRTEALLDMVGLKAVANRAVGTFSKGMARRIGLAQALINDPDLLILDEPTTGLDPIGTRQIKDLIIELAKRGKTILLCSHLLADVEDVCDRIAILYGGRIQAEGQVRDLLQRADKRQITTSSISKAALEQIEQIIQQEQADYDVSSPMEKLETFFIETVTVAQQQGRPTSGVISSDKSQISDFLAAKSAKKDMLDELVSASLSPEAPAKPPTTEKITPVEASEPEPDEQLLRNLTEQPEPKSVIRDQQAETEPVEQIELPQEQVKKSILDKLTDKPTADEKKKQASDSEEDSSDA